jgi:hypothetical protein
MSETNSNGGPQAMSETNIYNVPKGNWDELCRRLEKLTRRAKKLGKKTPVLNKIGEFNKVIDQKKGLVRTYYQCTIQSERVCVDDWDFLATIELGDTEIGLVVNRVPNMLSDIDIPQEFRKTTNYCSHCQKNVRRNNVYVVRHQKTHQWQQVGKNCLSDFIGGRDPEDIVKTMQMLIDFQSLCSGSQSDGFFGVSNYNYYLSLHSTLTFTNFVIQKKGWLSKTKANQLAMDGEYKTPTAGLINEAYFVIPKDQSRVVQQLIEDYDSLSTEDKEKLEVKVESAIEWARNIKEGDCNDYLNNLRILCSKDSFDRKHLGYVTSVLIAYDMANNKVVEKKEKPKSIHVGTIGKKEKFEVKVTHILFWPNQWGGTYAFMMEDKDGNKLIWKSSKVVDMESGHWYTITGSVKAHNEYKGMGQTELSRCKILGQIGEPSGK